MATPKSVIAQVQKKIWDGSLPVEIRLAGEECRSFGDGVDGYLVNLPRLSYLPFLLPRLHAFFQPHLIDPNVSAHQAWLSFQDVPLKWHYPVGLLYDLFSGAAPANPEDIDDGMAAESPLPWKLVLRFSDFPEDQLIRLDGGGKVLWDMFVNAVKEADVVRNGKGNVFLSLSKDDSEALWQAVQTHNLPKFNSVNNKLLNPPGIALRNIPLKIYLPTAPETKGEDQAVQASIRTVQSLVPPFVAGTKTQMTLGVALNSVLPTVFPSRRNPVLAAPVMHGAVVPMSAPVEDLMRCASYADGFLHVAIVML